MIETYRSQLTMVGLRGRSVPPWGWADRDDLSPVGGRGGQVERVGSQAESRWGLSVENTEGRSNKINFYIELIYNAFKLLIYCNNS